jgi:hypothetical protein
MPTMDRRSRREKRLDVAAGVRSSAWAAVVTTATLLRTVRNKPDRGDALRRISLGSVAAGDVERDSA